MSSALRLVDLRWLTLAAALLCAAALAAGDTVDLRCDGLPAGQAVALATGGSLPVATTPDLAERLDRPIRMVLVQADARARLQAIAHAMGCWYASDPAAAGAYRLSRLAGLPLAPDEARVVTSDLLHRADLMPAVRRITTPWMGPGSGLDYLADAGLWSATLPPAGHAQLVEFLATCSRCDVRVPPLLDDGIVGDANRRPSEAPSARTLGDLVVAISAAWSVSVSLGGDLDPATPVKPLPTVALSDLPAALAKHGVQAAHIGGVLCLGSTLPSDRLHPAERRRFAVLPVHHLCRDVDASTALAARLSARLALDTGEAVAGGWLLLPIHDRAVFILVADAPTIHGALVLMGEADRMGLDAWLARLNAP